MNSEFGIREMECEFGCYEFLRLTNLAQFRILKAYLKQNGKEDKAVENNHAEVVSETVPSESSSVEFDIEDGVLIKYNGKGSRAVIPDGVTVIGHLAFYDCVGLTSIEIPDSVTSIKNAAFLNCENLTSIEIPDSVTSIGDCVFYDCHSLTGIDIPSSVTSIGYAILAYCESLTRITVGSENTVYHSSGNCLIETAKKTLTSGCKNSVIPSDGSVTTIGGSAFSGCRDLTSIEIPNCVTTLDGCAFSECDSLASVNIPNSVTKIEYWAFRGCKRLKSIVIPNSVIEIGKHAFKDGNKNLIIYCAAAEKPRFWYYEWNKKTENVRSHRYKVIWGYKG